MTDYLAFDIEGVFNKKSGWEPTEKMKQTESYKNGERPFPPPAAWRIISACSLHLKTIPGAINEWDPVFLDYGPDLSTVPTEGPDQISEEMEYHMVQRISLQMANVIANGGTIVTFNGRGYDIPLLFARCMTFGIDTSGWYTKDFRYRFSDTGHVDLLDVATEYGAAYRNRPNLALLCRLFGLPGKVGIDGSQVEGFYKDGRYKEIRDYCMSDNMETGIVYLRWLVAKGHVTQQQYRTILFKIQDVACVEDENGEKVHPHMCKLFDMSDPNTLFLIRESARQ